MPAVCTREEPQGTCQVLVHGSSGTSSSCSPKTTSLKHRGQSQPENTEQGPPVVVNIRPELPTAAQWGRNPAKAFYKLLLYPVKLALYPLYKERKEVLEQHLQEPDSEEAKAVGKDIMEGIVKEQETVGLVGALLLSIASSILFTVPDAILDLEGSQAPLRDLYMLCSTYAFGAEATATCLSVLLILMLNAQQAGNPYRAVVRFLRGYWPVAGLTTMLAATGLLGLSGTVVLFTCAGYIAGRFTLVVPVLVGGGCIAAYCLAGVILGKMLLQALKPAW